MQPGRPPSSPLSPTLPHVVQPPPPVAAPGGNQHPPAPGESPNNLYPAPANHEVVNPSMMTNNAAVVAALQGKCDFPQNKMLRDYAKEVNERGHRLEDQPFYVGMLNGEDIAPYLKNVGDFGIHACDKDGGQVRLMLTVRGNTGIHHFELVFDARGRGWNFLPRPAGCQFFRTIIELVEFHKTYPLPSIPEKLILRDTITRPSWFLKHANVSFGKEDLLGKGNFCEVFRGKLDRRKLVAVKVCSANWRYTVENTSVNHKEKDAREALIKEGSVMSRIRHPNVITFYGICCDHPPIMIAIEFCPGNSLVNHLVNMKDAISVGERIKYLCEAAAGMAFLEKNDLIHRDLAARNCLISQYGRIKIADFGLSKLVSQLAGESWTKQHVPVRWMAPESLKPNPEYSSKSDVWAYGILTYEVFSYGEKPWPDWENKKIATYIRRGQMMELPNYTPPQIKAIVSEMWKLNYAERPDFATISKRMNHIQVLFPSPRPQLCTISRIKGVTVLSNQEIEVLEEKSEDIQVEAAASAMSTPQAPTTELPPSIHGNAVDKQGHLKNNKETTVEETDAPGGAKKNSSNIKKKNKARTRDATRDTNEENFCDKPQQQQQQPPQSKPKKKKKNKTIIQDQATLDDQKEARTFDENSNNTVETDDITQDREKESKPPQPAPRIKVEKVKPQRPQRLSDKFQGQVRETGVKSKPEHGKKRKTKSKL